MQKQSKEPRSILMSSADRAAPAVDGQIGVIIVSNRIAQRSINA